MSVTNTGLEHVCSSVGLNTRELLQELSVLSANDIIVLGGSVAEGTANPGSDIDLFRFCYSDNIIPNDIDNSLSIAGDAMVLTTMKLTSGFDVQLHSFSFSYLDGLLKRVESGSRLYDGEPSSFDDLPLPSYNREDLMILHELKIGVPILGADRLQNMCGSKLPTSLSRILIQRHMMFYSSNFASSISHYRSGNYESSLWVLRDAVVHIAAATLASFGYTNHRTKWLVEALRKYEQEIGPNIHTAIRRLLWINNDVSKDMIPVYEEVSALEDEVLKTILVNWPQLSPILSYLLDSVANSTSVEKKQSVTSLS